MIPAEITREHILAAIQDVDRNGIPEGRQSKRFQLLHASKTYPPKYVVSLAAKHATGRELNASEFSGGEETNSFLRELGFEILQASSPEAIAHKQFPAPRAPSQSRAMPHDERCPKCKEAVQKLLRATYGEVNKNHSFDLGALPDDFAHTQYHPHLRDIYEALQKHRGFADFVRARRLPSCDFFVPRAGLIVEFDESQHFTACRELALQRYPENLPVGFDRDKWIQLCRTIRAKDDSPPYRDEQRAWYDTLRDFLPMITGMPPTVRLHSQEFRWCALDADRAGDVERFKRLIENKANKDGSWLATVIVESWRPYSNEDRLLALSQIIDSVADRTQGDGILLFPGGWFSAEGQQARELYSWVEGNVRSILGRKRRNLVVILGVDGGVSGHGSARIASDQIAIAFGNDGRKAIARKFHPAPREVGHVELAKDHRSLEDGMPRILDFNRIRCFLCACYDSFGIKHRGIPNPGVEVVLDVIHGFHPKGHGSSGDVYFAKHGLAGASKEWNCLSFGAAVFFNRAIPPSWPSGVVWNQGSKSTQKWRYEDNPLTPTAQFDVAIKEGLASIRVFGLV